MLKIFFISIVSIYLVGCSNSNTLPSWDNSLGGVKEVAINKNLPALEKEFGNKNTF